MEINFIALRYQGRGPEVSLWDAQEKTGPSEVDTLADLAASRTINSSPSSTSPMESTRKLMTSPLVWTTMFMGFWSSARGGSFIRLWRSMAVMICPRRLISPKC